MFGTKTLEERESKFNGQLKVVRSLGLGTYIQAEGLTQSGGIVEAIWKSTLKKVHHSPITVHHSLILGLGGGTVAKLIRKSWPEAKITGIDIDPIMIELGKKYLNLNEYKVDIIIADASDLSNLSNLPNWPNSKFDLVIVDLYQGDKYPEKFETENYIQLLRTVLSSGGVIIFNRLYYGDKRPQAVKFGNKLKKIFSNVEWFYPEANLMFVCTI
ncbi:MAG: methyltransferase domain-containing protein [Candidatus Woesebacteria bacterium]|nr:methyltransferase domain-containing protein [Candidatus Woesebacteria bacterium]